MEYSDEIFDPFYKFGKLINFISVRILCLIKKQKKKKGNVWRTIYKYK